MMVDPKERPDYPSSIIAFMEACREVDIPPRLTDKNCLRIANLIRFQQAEIDKLEESLLFYKTELNRADAKILGRNHPLVSREAANLDEQWERKYARYDAAPEDLKKTE